MVASPMRKRAASAGEPGSTTARFARVSKTSGYENRML
jgi:hypothetical protein